MTFRLLVRMLYHRATEDLWEREDCDSGIIGTNPSAPLQESTYDPPITTLNTQPLSYRGLVGARPLN